jgi:hypothetical protein
MSNIDFSLDYEIVTEVANSFSQGSDNFNQQLGPLMQAGELLAKQHFIGLSGNAENNVLGLLHAETQRIAARCLEMSDDLHKAVQDYQNADDQSMPNS